MTTRELIIALTAWGQAYEQHYRQEHDQEPPQQLMETVTAGEQYLERSSIGRSILRIITRKF